LGTERKEIRNMALTSAYVQVYGQLTNVFKKLRDGQAPDQFTLQHLKDLGFITSNYRAVIPLLKALGFLDADGRPTNVYHEYRSEAQNRRVMAEALRRAYGDIFVLKAKPTEKDRDLIQGKFKSVHNASENAAKLMANTFFALMALADMAAESASPAKKQPEKEPPEKKPEEVEEEPGGWKAKNTPPTLHYNIQIHLPATKDVEVFNAIFKSLKEHLLD
jgi:hypothetical protein